VSVPNIEADRYFMRLAAYLILSIVRFAIISYS
jgi:hypothetical protein